MSQLSFWDESLSPSTSTAADPSGRKNRAVSGDENKSAIRCRASADALQRHIDAKHQSANNMLAQPPTRKRLQDADGLRRQAIRLERIQETLRRLADMHVNGNVPPELACLTTRSALENALFTSPGDSAIFRLFNSVQREERTEERVLRLTREAATMNIPGYFPTPDPLADRLVEMACIESGNTILEPSAGTGNLIDAVLKNHREVKIAYCELNCLLLDILHLKYEKVPGVRFLGRDFFDIDSSQLENRFERIIMNPPFERGQDIDHVSRAWYSLLAPGGILTAVVSAGVFSRKDKKATEFQGVFRRAKSIVQDVPEGSFKISGTGVATKIVQLCASP